MTSHSLYALCNINNYCLVSRKWRKMAPITAERERAIHAIVFRSYRDLGRFTFHEVAVLVLFLILVFLWVFRQPGFMNGWVDLVGNQVWVRYAWKSDGHRSPEQTIDYLMNSSYRLFVWCYFLYFPSATHLHGKAMTHYSHCTERACEL